MERMILQGVAASPGIAIAKAYHLQHTDLTAHKTIIEDVDKELQRLEEALVASKSALEMIQRQALQQLGEDKAAIFAAHLLVLSDPELLQQIKEKIIDEKVNAQYAVHEVAAAFIVMFESMDNEYMRERATDIRDVTKRIIANLLGVVITDPGAISEEVIIIADDLTPSDTAQLNRQFVKGFTTNIGGRTSHSAIMARSMEIPAVVGVKTITTHIKDGVLIIVDGLEGKVIIHPTVDELKQYEEKQRAYEVNKLEWAQLIHQKTVTADGSHVKLEANIGTSADIESVLQNGAEGIGLYRTEFLYMGREQLPSEEEQFIAYKTVLAAMDGKPVMIRTLDIGGDKELPYLELPKELNPFLGFRAIRLCLEMQGMFRTQLRALLRASIYGNLRVMFPMIATLEELRQAKAILQEEKLKLLQEGIKVSESIEVGIMVEIPSTAVMADLFAREVDFFSIGTNDLIQYTFAADRMNERVAYLYQPYNPAILRLIKMTIDAAHKYGKVVGMCGEMAGDEVAIPILLGLGLDEFSMSTSSILRARSQIAKLTMADLQQLADCTLTMNTATEVEHLVRQSVL